MGNKVVAVMAAAEFPFPMGRRQWQLTGGGGLGRRQWQHTGWSVGLYIKPR